MALPVYNKLRKSDMHSFIFFESVTYYSLQSVNNNFMKYKPKMVNAPEGLNQVLLGQDSGADRRGGEKKTNFAF